MKKTPSLSLRKHGARARAVRLSYDIDTREGVRIGARLKTSVVLESGAQSYRWCTDRGRSRLIIKH